MDDGLNPKACYFCNKPSAKKYILNPQTKILNEIFLTALYAGKKYPICETCAAAWDTALNNINDIQKIQIDNLFESMVIKKGALVADGMHKSTE